MPSRAQQTAHSQQTVAQGAFKVCGKLHTVNERNFYIVRLSSHARLEAFAIQPNTILQTAHSQHNSDTGWLQSVRQTTQSENSGNRCAQDDRMRVTKDRQQTMAQGVFKVCMRLHTVSTHSGTGCLESVQQKTTHSQQMVAAAVHRVSKWCATKWCVHGVQQTGAYTGEIHGVQ